MKFILSSKTESETQPGKIQLTFRYIEPDTPTVDMNPNQNPQPYMYPMNAINFNGAFEKTDADAFEVGATYEMTLKKVK